ncbi:MAG: DNA primase catalytic subunit PriS, partial [Euryarchaeota archaeon]|nr:DNA primase catalytic subunit PriS [Euryarchaeota archaeon]
FIRGIAALNMGLVDAKVTIDLKRILRLPTSLHSMVSMKCMEVKNIESFDPFREAVPKFVYEREDKE